jgi:hypothetical protein
VKELIKEFHIEHNIISTSPLQFPFQATPLFISLMLLELVVSWILKGKPPGRLDDALTSLSAGVLSRLPR